MKRSRREVGALTRHQQAESTDFSPSPRRFQRPTVPETNSMLRTFAGEYRDTRRALVSL